MDETLKAAQESPSADSRAWIGRILVAVILGEAIWAFVVSITRDLAVPAMARAMGGDPQSPLYLGKGDFNVAALFTSLLELCFAGIVAVVLNSWSGKPRRVPARTARIASVATPAQTSVVASPANATASPAGEGAMQAVAKPPQPATPTVQPVPPVAKPEKPKPPKEVYYNIVGEPIESDDE